MGGLVFGGCREPTQITVVLSTDVECSRVVETTLGVGTLSNVNDKPPVSSRKGCKNAAGRIGSLVVVPSGDDGDEVALLAVMSVDGAENVSCAPLAPGPKCVVARRALRYVPHTPLTLPIELSTSCLGVKCDPTETCFKGLCVSATIPDPEQCTDPASCVPKWPAADGGADAAPDAAGDAPADAPGDADAGSEGGILDPDLVLYFDFETGTVTDKSGYGSVATATKATWSATSGYGGSGELIFDGANNLSGVAVQPSPTLAAASSSGGVTYAAWVRPMGNAGAGGGYFFELVNTSDVYFRLAPGALVPWAIVGINGASGTPLPMATRTHLAMTYQKGTALLLYVNGKLVDSSGTSNPVSFGFAGPLNLGKGITGGLDEVRIYRRVLAASEIAALAQ